MATDVDSVSAKDLVLRFAKNRGYIREEHGSLVNFFDSYIDKLDQAIEEQESRPRIVCNCFPREEENCRASKEKKIDRKKKRRSVCQIKPISILSSSEDELFDDEKEQEKLEEEADDELEEIEKDRILEDEGIEIKKRTSELPAMSDYREDIDSSSDDDAFDDFVKSTKARKKKNEFLSSEDEEDSFDDFIVEDVSPVCKVKGSKTPKSTELKTPKITPYRGTTESKTPKITPYRSISESKTPKITSYRSISESKTPKINTYRSTPATLLDKVKTPKTPATNSAAYKREYKQLRDETSRELFEIFNESVFESKLPKDLPIIFNKRMTSTAGFCYYTRNRATKVRSAKIELAEKVCDTVERLRDTLIHELCHAAAWLIDGKQCGHGPAWKYWANKAHGAHADLPPISRCHQYSIEYKYNYHCQFCNQSFGRHSKSLKQCPSCLGPLELFGNDGVTPYKQRKANAFALFMKENYANMKSENPRMVHADLMKLLGKKFQDLKV